MCTKGWINYFVYYATTLAKEEVERASSRGEQVATGLRQFYDTSQTKFCYPYSVLKK